MTRTIKASEVKPGMEIQWTHAGITTQCIPSHVDTDSPRRGAYLRTSRGAEVRIPDGVEVTVLSEPAPPQPEEPTEFGARVVVDGRQFVLVNTALHMWSDTAGLWTPWKEVCALGPVTVVPDQGWTVPDTPEVPDRIEEWPENDEHLKDHMWRDKMGAIWSSWDGKWGYQVCGGKWRPLLEEKRPFDGPWTRVTDA